MAYLPPVTNIALLNVDPSTSSIEIGWTWTPAPPPEPQQPTGFSIERSIGFLPWKILSYATIPTDREYTDILSDEEGKLVFGTDNDVKYRIKPYWIEL